MATAYVETNFTKEFMSAIMKIEIEKNKYTNLYTDSFIEEVRDVILTVECKLPIEDLNDKQTKSLGYEIYQYLFDFPIQLKIGNQLDHLKDIIDITNAITRYDKLMTEMIRLISDTNYVFDDEDIRVQLYYYVPLIHERSSLLVKRLSEKIPR
jgi:hypothetical protein